VQRLIAHAREVARRAYAPYSHFHVGAALEDGNGVVHVGCNVENASYGLSVCAERSAVFCAIAAGGARPFRSLAVACVDADVGGCSPCGACRQVIAEHFAPDARIWVDGVGSFSPAELLPNAFRLQA
jgi:cytidine deaminase